MLNALHLSLILRMNSHNSISVYVSANHQYVAPLQAHGLGSKNAWFGLEKIKL